MFCQFQIQFRIFICGLCIFSKNWKFSSHEMSYWGYKPHSLYKIMPDSLMVYTENLIQKQKLLIHLPVSWSQWEYMIRGLSSKDTLFHSWVRTPGLLWLSGSAYPWLHNLGRVGGCVWEEWGGRGLSTETGNTPSLWFLWFSTPFLQECLLGREGEGCIYHSKCPLFPQILNSWLVGHTQELIFSNTL